MRFSSYMNEWLYGDKGYYQEYRAIGKGGDFYTAVSTSSFFGASIANYFYTLIQKDGYKRDGYVIEIGAHQGYLISDMIQWLYTIDSSLVKSLKFAIVERHKNLQKAQKEYIYSRFGNDIEIIHFDSLDDIDVDYAFFVANEIFDSFSCELFRDNKIAIVDNHKIVWENAPNWIFDFAKKYRLKMGEIPLGYDEFSKNMVKSVKSCDFVTFDYGEKLVRNDFSIRVYQKHQTFPLFDKELDLATVYKRADITYDVNFGYLIDTFISNGFTLDSYETQARALVRFGIIDILDMFRQKTDYSKYLREADKIKTLIAPTIMGDKFKMIHFYK